MTKTQERPVTDLISHRPMTRVVVPLVDRLRLLEPVPNVVKELCPLLHAASYSWDPGFARLV